MDRGMPNGAYASLVTSGGKDVTQTLLACSHKMPEAWTAALVHLGIKSPSVVLAEASFNYREFKYFVFQAVWLLKVPFTLLHMAVAHKSKIPQGQQPL